MNFPRQARMTKLLVYLRTEPIETAINQPAPPNHTKHSHIHLTPETSSQ